MGGEGSQEVCKDSSALSHHYNPLRLYHRLSFLLQLIKSPWARGLGQVSEHKGKTAVPFGLFLANATALLFEQCLNLDGKARSCLCQHLVKSRMSRHNGMGEIVKHLV